MGSGNVGARRGAATTVRTPGVTIFFQCYPGVHGTPAQRGIAGVPFTARVAGQPDQAGVTGADGGVHIAVPATATECTLQIFGVDYRVRLDDSPGMLMQPGDMRPMHDGDPDDAFPTVAELLYRLGYHRPAPLLSFSNEMGRELDKAILDFQVNEDLTPRADGVVGPGTFARMGLRFRGTI